MTREQIDEWNRLRAIERAAFERVTDCPDEELQARVGAHVRAREKMHDYMTDVFMQYALRAK